MTHDAFDKTSKQIMKWLTVAPTDSVSPVTEEDSEMIPVVAEAALRGEDIRQTYPRFWQALLVRTRLRVAFLQVILALETPASELPRVPTPDWLAEELARIPPSPQVRQYSRERWAVNWRQTAGQVNYQIEQHIETTRRSRRMMTHIYGQVFTMLRAEVALESGELNVLLELTRSAELPLFQPTLFVNFDPAPAIPDTPLVATLSWGSYAERVALQLAPVTFPPVPLTAVADAETDRILFDLHLSIETL